MITYKEETMVEKKVEETKNRVEVTQVVTQTEVAYKLPTGEVLSFPEYLVWMGNQLIELKKKL